MITTADAAAQYNQRKWKPIPVSRRTKKALGKSWQHRAYDPNQFDSNSQNVGVQLGEVSGGLVDVDLDSIVAIGLAPEFLPQTDALFGRKSKPCSHQLYVSPELCALDKAAIQFKEYLDGKAGPVIVELRVGGNGKGAVSVFPPSMHVTGERVEWVRNGEPARVAGDDLLKAVLKLAVTALLQPQYPGEGSRHEGALVLGGVLARAGWTVADIEHVMRVLARSAGDTEVVDRVNAARGAVEAKAKGVVVSGRASLANLWGKDAADTLTRWLRLARADERRAPQFSDDNLALQFAERYGADWRYVAFRTHWLFWGTSRWVVG